MNNKLEQILNCLREANAEGMIVDTIWMDDDQTLFDFIELCIEEAALAQQQEAEPVAWRNKKEGHRLISELRQRVSVESESDYEPLYLHPPKPAAQPVDYVPVVNELLRYAEGKTCRHETTHRGGTIWEICDDCGQKWADDRGGRPEWVEPKALEDAFALLASGPAAQPQVPEGYQLVPVDVIRFLHGAGTLDGLWFGEARDTKTKAGMFWWRKYLPKASAAKEEGK